MGRGGTPALLPPFPFIFCLCFFLRFSFSFFFPFFITRLRADVYREATLTCQASVLILQDSSNSVLSQESFGLLVPLGFAVAGFTPAAYQRRRLRRPSRRSYLGEGFALRCFQRLSFPDAATRPCTWRYNRLTVGPSTTVLSY